MGEVGFSGGTPDGASRKKVGKTKRQRAYVENRKRGMTKTDAALKANYSLKTARNAKAKIETPEMVEEIEQFRAGIARAFPSPRLIKTLDDGLNATRVVTASFEGKITDEAVYADQAERRKTVETIAKLSGRISSEPTVNVNPTFNVIIRDVGRPDEPRNMAPAETTTIVRSS